MNESAGLNEVRCVSFDAAGTLLHPYPSVGDVYEEIARAHGCACSAAALNEGFRSAFGFATKEKNIRDPEARERDFWRQVVQKTFALAAAEVTYFEPMFADLWEAFAHAERWRVTPDAESTLHVLRVRGYQLAVISNWDRRLHTVLRETKLRRFFDAVIISSEVGSEKPGGKIFCVAQEALQTVPRECLHIGDSRHDDLEGALAAGWQARVVRHDESVPTGDGIGRLAQLVTLLPGPPSRRGRQHNL